MATRRRQQMRSTSSTFTRGDDGGRDLADRATSSVITTTITPGTQLEGGEPHHHHHRLNQYAHAVAEEDEDEDENSKGERRIITQPRDLGGKSEVVGRQERSRDKGKRRREQVEEGQGQEERQEAHRQGKRVKVLGRELKGLGYWFVKEEPSTRRVVKRSLEQEKKRTSGLGSEGDKQRKEKSARGRKRKAIGIQEQKTDVAEHAVEKAPSHGQSAGETLSSEDISKPSQQPKSTILPPGKRRRIEGQKSARGSSIDKKPKKAGNRELEALSYWYIKDSAPVVKSVRRSLDRDAGGQFHREEGQLADSANTTEDSARKGTKTVQDDSAVKKYPRVEIILPNSKASQPTSVCTQQLKSSQSPESKSKTKPPYSWTPPGPLWQESESSWKENPTKLSPESQHLKLSAQTLKHKPNVAIPLFTPSTPLKPKLWPRSQRFVQNDPLPEDTVCISQFLTDDDVKELMPDLDEAVLTRARKRAEGPRGERLLNRRASSSQAEVVGVRRNSVVNGVSTIGGMPSAHSKPLPIHSVPRPESSTQSTAPERKVHPKRKKEERPLERNIDNVIFGDVTFKAWYPSWYPKEIIGEKGLNGDNKGIVVNDLYVCKRCFAYAKVAVDWVRHTRCCEKDVPGEKIYTHGAQGTWSIWEVDGDVDTLFCQNLSLFAKLFLDNKSVFFDVSGFKYFLLVHSRTLPSPPSSSTSIPVVQNQILGFFSKEKMSWDNNNLACILVFPPWQRKSLGTLLMGVSYAISKREKVLGGPEKPISELGRKGYKRYWGAEIARWLLDSKETDKKGRGAITIADVSEGTWIVADDCLGILREMDVVEEVAASKAKDVEGEGMVEQRVRIDKQKVRAWVENMGLSLDRVVDEAGFVEGYAMPEQEEDEEEDEDEVMADE